MSAPERAIDSRNAWIRGPPSILFLERDLAFAKTRYRDQARQTAHKPPSG
jgi:hypothetical protein